MRMFNGQAVLYGKDEKTVLPDAARVECTCMFNGNYVELCDACKACTHPAFGFSYISRCETHQSVYLECSYCALMECVYRGCADGGAR